mmetsp:Transcript_2401/g.7166  ORF Transcript_2401/g.7166 Transcript_2401/m.7166 type:complete len:268 (+) Transcript_2401:297-1100(+)
MTLDRADRSPTAPRRTRMSFCRSPKRLPRRMTKVAIKTTPRARLAVAADGLGGGFFGGLAAGLEVLLVVPLGVVEDGEVLEFGDDRAAGVLGLFLVEAVLRDGEVVGGVDVDAVAVLGASVVADLVEGEAVFAEAVPEEVAEGRQVDEGGVVGDLDGLGVAGGAGADLFVRRIGRLAVGVADFRRDDAQLALERQLDAPETAAAERDVAQGSIVEFVEYGDVETRGLAGERLVGVNHDRRVRDLRDDAVPDVRADHVARLEARRRVL